MSCNDEAVSDCYIGQTNNLKIRIKRHRNNTVNEKQHCYGYKLYECIRENGGFENWKFDILETTVFPSKAEALERETVLIREHNATLNKIVPSRSDAQYKIDKHEEILQKSREHYKEHRDEILERARQRYQEDAETIREKNKQRMREWRAKLSDEKKEEVKAKALTKVACDKCGKEVVKNGIKRHQSRGNCV